MKFSGKIFITRAPDHPQACFRVEKNNFDQGKNPITPKIPEKGRGPQKWGGQKLKNTNNVIYICQVVFDKDGSTFVCRICFIII